MIIKRSENYKRTSAVKALELQLEDYREELRGLRVMNLKHANCARRLFIGDRIHEAKLALIATGAYEAEAFDEPFASKSAVR